MDKKISESMFLKFGYFLKNKALPQKAVLLKHSQSHYHKYAAQKHTKIHDSIQITETIFEQKKCSKIKLQ
jgi:hypothetical protein